MNRRIVIKVDENGFVSPAALVDVLEELRDFPSSPFMAAGDSPAEEELLTVEVGENVFTKVRASLLAATLREIATEQTISAALDPLQGK